MTTVRLKDELHREVAKFVRLKENRYKYGSITDFINETVYEKLSQLKTISRFKKLIKI